MPSKRSGSPSPKTASAANGGSQSAPYAHVPDFRNMPGYVPPTAEERLNFCTGPPTRPHPVDQYAQAPHRHGSHQRNCCRTEAEDASDHAGHPVYDPGLYPA